MQLRDLSRTFFLLEFDARIVSAADRRESDLNVLVYLECFQFGSPQCGYIVFVLRWIAHENTEQPQNLEVVPVRLFLVQTLQSIDATQKAAGSASAAALTQAQRIVSRLRCCWPQVKALLRADSSFARNVA